MTYARVIPLNRPSGTPSAGLVERKARRDAFRKT